MEGERVRDARFVSFSDADIKGDVRRRRRGKLIRRGLRALYPRAARAVEPVHFKF